MKNVLIFLFCSIAMAVSAQETLLAIDTIGFGLPPNLQAGKGYVRCIIDDEFERVDKNDTSALAKNGIVTTRKKWRKVSDELTEHVIDSTIWYKTTARWTRKKRVKPPFKLLDANYSLKLKFITCEAEHYKWTMAARGDAWETMPPEFCLMPVCKIVSKFVDVPLYKLEKMPKKIVRKDTLNLSETELNRYFELVSESISIDYTHEIVKSVGKYAVYTENCVVYGRKLVRKGGFTEWKENIVCMQFQPYNAIDIQNALQKKGYYHGKIERILSPAAKAALVKYQKDNDLPIGSLDLKTMRSLGL